MKAMRFLAAVVLAVGAVGFGGKAQAADFFDAYKLQRGVVSEDIEACPGGDCSTLVGQGDLVLDQVTENADEFSFSATVKNYKCIETKECTATDLSFVLAYVSKKNLSLATPANYIPGSLIIQPKGARVSFGGPVKCHFNSWDPVNGSTKDYSSGVLVACSYYSTATKGYTALFFFEKK